jgi:hypothetical protein
MGGWYEEGEEERRGRRGRRGARAGRERSFIDENWYGFMVISECSIRFLRPAQR